MKGIIRKTLWCMLGLAVAGCLILDLMPQPKSEPRLSRLPLQGLGYAGRTLSLSEAEQGVFQGASVIKRIYQIGKNRVVLLAVDSDMNRHAIHDPVHCFRGAGWSVAGETVMPLPGGYGKIFKLAKDKETAETLYWMTDGRHRHASPVKVWWQSTTRRLHLTSDQSPVLVLLQPAAGSAVDWSDVLNNFPDLIEL
jgi:hypothetical protein